MVISNCNRKSVMNIVYAWALMACWAVLAAGSYCMDDIPRHHFVHDVSCSSAVTSMTTQDQGWREHQGRGGCIISSGTSDPCPSGGITPADESQQMTGNIMVGLVVVNGPYPHNIDYADAIKLRDDIDIGLNDFLTYNEPLANIKFTVKLYHETTTVTPLNSPDFLKCETQWRDPVMTSILRYSTSGAAAVKAFASKLYDPPKPDPKPDAAFVAFITKYPSPWKWAYASGMYTDSTGTHDYRNRLVMSIGNQTVENVKRTMCHETCHIFGACDEYEIKDSNGINCKTPNCFESGIHKVRNCNTAGGCKELECSTATTPQVPCLMINQFAPNPWNICQYTRGQIGWPWWKLTQPLSSPASVGIGYANLVNQQYNSLTFMAYQTDDGIDPTSGGIKGIKVSTCYNGQLNNHVLKRELNAWAGIGCAWFKYNFYMSWYGTVTYNNGTTDQGIVVASPSNPFNIHEIWIAGTRTDWFTNHGFGLTALKDKLYMAYLGKDGVMIHIAQSTDPTTANSWSDNGGLAPYEKGHPYKDWGINQGIGFTTHNDTLYFAYCTNNKKIILGRMNGDIKNWTLLEVINYPGYNNLLPATCGIGLTSYTNVKTNKSYLYMAYGAADKTDNVVMVGYLNDHNLWIMARINSVENIADIEHAAIGLAGIEYYRDAKRYSALSMAYVRKDGQINLCHQENPLQAGSLPKLSLGTLAKL